jgi:hypothetical protein
MDIANKLEKVDTAFTINMYDNGYMFEISGRKIGVDEYCNCKIIANTSEELIELVREAIAMPKNE